MPFYSQFGEDSWIVNNLSLPKLGTFLDIGAWDGVESSNSLHFEELGWKGICVEPTRAGYEPLLRNRKCLCLNLAAGNRIEMREFRLNDGAPGLSGFESHGRAIRMMSVRCDHLWHGFSEDPPTIASIDTEGTELDVWKGFGDLRPFIVVMEFWTQPQPPRDKEIVEQLTKDGYKEVHRTEANLIFTLT